MSICGVQAVDGVHGPRRRSHRPEVEATRLRILRAAEALYARRGFDGVSLREIAVAAGQGNNNAVQYHFGSREDLIEAIFRQRVAEMEDERTEKLVQAGRDGRLNDVATLVAILSVPHLALCNERGDHPHAGFLLHYLARNLPDERRRNLTEIFADAPAMARLLDLLSSQLADLPHDLAQTRIMLCLLMFLNLLVHHDAIDRQVGDATVLARRSADTIMAMTAALRQPFVPDRITI